MDSGMTAIDDLLAGAGSGAAIGPGSDPGAVGAARDRLEEAAF